MGCITSKVMSKSISFKEELSQSLQRRSNSIKELIISGSGNYSEQFLDTVHVSTEKCKQSHTTNRLVQPLPTGLVMEADDLATRSKSCHWIQEHRVSTDSYDEIKEDGSNTSKKVRRIHTVEEYDAILEELWLSKKSTNGASQREKRSTETSSSAEKEKSCDKGSKRRAVAKGLESLSLPQTIEFQDGLQVDSPGAYVTPKFGSYALPCCKAENKCSGSVAFSPELVTAFEECMEKLQAEEEILLKQIAEDFKEESNNDKQAVREEKNLSHSKDTEVHIYPLQGHM